jgi:hypothetical protein
MTLILESCETEIPTVPAFSEDGKQSYPANAGLMEFILSPNKHPM